MVQSGQFCAIGRSLDVIGGRWTLLVVRELLCGSTRFNDILRGVPRVSRTVLSDRLHLLVESGLLVRTDGVQGPEYALTPAGRELFDVLSALGSWGQRWLPRNAFAEDLDLDPVLTDVARRIRWDATPAQPCVVCFDLAGLPRRFLLVKRGESSICAHNPGFPEAVTVKGPLAAFVSWWRGDLSLAEAQRAGLRLEGEGDAVRDFPSWFDRYLFAEVGSQRPDPHACPSYAAAGG